MYNNVISEAIGIISVRLKSRKKLAKLQCIRFEFNLGAFYGFFFKNK